MIFYSSLMFKNSFYILYEKIILGVLPTFCIHIGYLHMRPLNTSNGFIFLFLFNPPFLRHLSVSTSISIFFCLIRRTCSFFTAKFDCLSST